MGFLLAYGLVALDRRNCYTRVLEAFSVLISPRRVQRSHLETEKEWRWMFATLYELQLALSSCLHRCSIHSSRALAGRAATAC